MMYRKCWFYLRTTLRSRLPRCQYYYVPNVPTATTHTCSYCAAASTTTTTTITSQPHSPITTRIPKIDIHKVVYDPKEEMSEAEVKHIKLDPKPQPINDGDGGKHHVKLKFALLLSFNGQGLYGLQKNSTGNSIEDRLLDAMLSAGLITREEHRVPQLFRFRISSRTDKGVSAARLIVSGTFKESNPSVIKNKINTHIRGPIRVMGVYKTIKSFSGKDWCDSRSYSYTCPTFAFASYTEVVQDSYRLSKEGLEDIRSLFSVYEGNNNFHNFTKLIKSWEMRAKRQILKVECTDPFEHNGIEWITINIEGRSFLLHQIRKMVGLVISVRRGLAGINAIKEALTQDYVFLPIAPGLGLVLQDQKYHNYNKKYGNTVNRMPLCWESEQESIEEFYRENILKPIMKTEIEERSMFRWLKTLPCSSFDMVKNTGNRDINEKNIKELRDPPSPLTVAYRILYPSKTSDNSTDDDDSDSDEEVTTSSL